MVALELIVQAAVWRVAGGGDSSAQRRAPMCSVRPPRCFIIALPVHLTERPTVTNPLKTDWNLIRDALNAAIDSCENLENIGYSEEDRGKTIDIGGRLVSVQDFLVSGWTIAEHARYQVIRERHEKRDDLPYVPETSRILV